MKKLFLFSVCILFLFAASNAQTTKPKSIVGTWRLVEFTDFDSATQVWVYRYGKNPKGYFTYTAGGVVSINISNDTPLKLSEEESKTKAVNLYDYITKNSFGYFGTYIVEAGQRKVIHQVKSGTIPWYTDTDQPRQIELKGDTLIIGDNKTTKRVLVSAD